MQSYKFDFVQISRKNISKVTFKHGILTRIYNTYKRITHIRIHS